MLHNSIWWKSEIIRFLLPALLGFWMKMSMSVCWLALESCMFLCRYYISTEDGVSQRHLYRWVEENSLLHVINKKSGWSCFHRSTLMFYLVYLGWGQWICFIASVWPVPCSKLTAHIMMQCWARIYNQYCCTVQVHLSSSTYCT